MFRNIHILLIEDDDIEIEYITRAFNKAQMNCPITCVPSAMEALHILQGKSSRVSISLPYVILLDSQLPGINGIEFLQILRQEPILKASVVFVLTHLANEYNVNAAYLAGVAGYILKDNTKEDYHSLVEFLKAYFIVTTPFNNFLFSG